MAAYMDAALREVPGIKILKRDPRHTTRSFYIYICGINPKIFKVNHEVICYALKNGGHSLWEGYPAMHHCVLFQPKLSRLPVSLAFPERFDFSS
jgi:hypothetical protein